MSDGSLTIDPKERKKKESMRKLVTVDRGEPTEHLIRKLVGAYLAGYNIIEVRSKERMDLDVKHAGQGFRPAGHWSRGNRGDGQHPGHARPLDPVELPQKKCVRRMHLIVDSMHRDAITAFDDRGRGPGQEVIDRDQDVDRLYWMTVKAAMT